MDFYLTENHFVLDIPKWKLKMISHFAISSLYMPDYMRHLDVSFCDFKIGCCSL